MERVLPISTPLLDPRTARRRTFFCDQRLPDHLSAPIGEMVPWQYLDQGLLCPSHSSHLAPVFLLRFAVHAGDQSRWSACPACLSGSHRPAFLDHILGLCA